MKIKRNTRTKLQLISFQSILLLLKKPEIKKKKNIIQINMTVFMHLSIYLFFQTKYFNRYSDYHMIMVQKLHSVRLLVLYDSMHIRFHMACFAFQIHPESSQSLILISLEGELWV